MFEGGRGRDVCPLPPSSSLCVMKWPVRFCPLILLSGTCGGRFRYAETSGGGRSRRIIVQGGPGGKQVRQSIRFCFDFGFGFESLSKKGVCKEGFFTRESTKIGRMGRMGVILPYVFISMVGG